MLNTVDEVIEALGGPSEAAIATAVGSSAVSNWRARGKISQDVFILVRDALAARGKEADPAVFGFKTLDEARI